MRTGARGIFLFDRTSFSMLCKCIQCVARGEVWITASRWNCLVGALSEVPTLRVVNSNGRFLLTPGAGGGARRRRFDQSRCCNRTRALRAHHKNISPPHLDKVGISSRVDLVLYAMAH